MGTLHIENVHDDVIRNYEHIHKNQSVNEQLRLAHLIEEIINLWTQSHSEADRTESSGENVKWLKVGKNRSFRLCTPVRMRGEGPTALEMVQEGRT